MIELRVFVFIGKDDSFWEQHFKEALPAIPPSPICNATQPYILRMELFPGTSSGGVWVRARYRNPGRPLSRLGKRAPRHCGLPLFSFFFAQEIMSFFRFFVPVEKAKKISALFAYLGLLLFDISDCVSEPLLFAVVFDFSPMKQFLGAYD